ncbi:MAG: tryptophan 2,3-dioxygenase [Phycisphaerales bacterium]|nr:tryptophan 2,3-dioxygenase [Phycisphaerales bacterium]NNM25078.1 tryptophan 2,3-dioxygenase [Phycisphaerales bacterium]
MSDGKAKATATSPGAAGETADLTYASYLRIPELLSLQQVRSDPPEHDELLFIVIHQTYELWFKLLLHELERASRDLTGGDLYGAIAAFERCRTIMKTLVSQLDILETMTPMSFTSFRDRLETSSGFQSTQFREMEFLLGYKRPAMMKHLPAGSPGLPVLERRLGERSVAHAFHDFLARHGVELPDAVRKADVRETVAANETVQRGLLELYRTRPDLVILFELMTDFDEGLQEWRYRHVKAVERTIGSKHGTGGSLGVDFLKRTLFHPVFPDLWEIRHAL